MTVQFRNIRVKHLKGDAGAARININADSSFVVGQKVISKDELVKFLKAQMPNEVVLSVHPTVQQGKVLETINLCQGLGIERFSLQVAAAKEDTKKVVLIAGPKSHGYGAHEHKAGCMLLAEASERQRARRSRRKSSQTAGRRMNRFWTMPTAL